MGRCARRRSGRRRRRWQKEAGTRRRSATLSAALWGQPRSAADRQRLGATAISRPDMQRDAMLQGLAIAASIGGGLRTDQS